MPDAGAAGEERISEDRLLGGRLLLRQPASGHRAGTDAVLLAAACGDSPGDLILDIGAGVGAVGLAVALRHAHAGLVLAEKDPGLAALARQNLGLNGLAPRGRVIETDVLSPATRRAAGLRDGEASLILTNPPFFAPERVRASPDRRRSAAHVLAAEQAQSGEAMLSRWVRACVALLRPNGRLVMIHRAEAIGALLAAMEGRLGAVRILPVYPRQDAVAIRVLVSATRGSRAPPALAPGLVLHEASGQFTARAEAIHRGEATIPL